MSATTRTRLKRDEAKVQTRRDLLAAAREQIALLGVTAASIRTISEAAGYSQGAFYSHFRSKDDMLLEVMQAHLDGVAGRFEAFVAAVTGGGCKDHRTEEALQGIARYFENLNPDPGWSILAVELQLYARRAPDFVSRYDDVRSVFQGRLGAAMSALFDRLKLRPVLSPIALAKGFLSMSVGFSIQGGAMMQEERAAVMLAFFEAILETARPDAEGAIDA